MKYGTQQLIHSNTKDIWYSVMSAVQLLYSALLIYLFQKIAFEFKLETR